MKTYSNMYIYINLYADISANQRNYESVNMLLAGTRRQFQKKAVYLGTKVYKKTKLKAKNKKLKM